MISLAVWNVRGLASWDNLQHAQAALYLKRQPDLTILTETNLGPEYHGKQDNLIRGYQCFHSARGTGKGVSMLVRKDSPVTVVKVNTPTVDALVGRYLCALLNIDGTL
mgnify:CR=1 FL=1